MKITPRLPSSCATPPVFRAGLQEAGNFTLVVIDDSQIVRVGAVRDNNGYVDTGHPGAISEPRRAFPWRSP
jgi:hypothetical protein